MTAPGGGDNIQVQITGTVAPLTTAMKEGAAAVATATESMRASLNKISVTSEQARAAWARSGGDMQKFARELAGASGNIAAAQNTVTVAATKVEPALKQVSNAVRSMAFSAIGAAPGVSQLTGALGPMAIGSPLMVAVLAGIAALAYAWEYVSKASKEAEASQQKARSTLEGIREKGRNPVLGNLPGAISQETFHLQDLQAELATWQRRVNSPGWLLEQGTVDANIARLKNEIGESKNLIAAGHTEERRLTKEHAAQLAQDAETANNKRIAAAKKAAQELEAARVDVASAAAAKAKAFNDVLAGTKKVGDDAVTRDTERVEKEAKAYQSLQAAMEAASAAGERIRKEIAADWKRTFDDITGAFGRAITAASTKAGFLREVWRSVWYDMVQTSAAAGASMLAQHVANMLAENGVTRKAVTERVALETWAAIKTVAIKSWEAIRWIAIEAAKAAAAAWSALAGIPVVGPALGIAAAAATFAGVLALAKGIGGGGGAPSGSSSGGGGGGTGARSSAQQGQTVNIYAVDAKSFRQMAMRHRDVFTDVVATVVKEGGLTPKKLGMA